MFARRVFLIAGIYGLLVIFPLYFSEARIGTQYPPAITHPEYYYGFTGVTVAFQILFILMSRDPVRYRPLMPAAMVEKATFVIAVAVLYAAHRVPSMIVAGAVGDLILLILFVAAYLRTPGEYETSNHE